MNQRIEQILDQMSQWNQTQRDLITQLMITVSDKMIAEIINQSEKQYPGLGLLIHPDQELYYKVPDPEIYIEAYKNVLGLDFGSDAEIYLASVDIDENPGTRSTMIPISIGISVFWPDQERGITIAAAMVPETDKLRLNVYQAINTQQVKENHFFTPYLARFIRDLEEYYSQKRDSQTTIMAIALKIYNKENQ